MMVPLYAVASFFSLLLIEHAVLFDTPRDCYEAYVIYNFVALMIDYMGGDREAHEFFEREPPQPHLWPFGFLQPHNMETFLRRVKVLLTPTPTALYRTVNPNPVLSSARFNTPRSSLLPRYGASCCTSLALRTPRRPRARTFRFC